MSFSFRTEREKGQAGATGRKRAPLRGGDEIRQAVCSIQMEISWRSLEWSSFPQAKQRDILLPLASFYLSLTSHTRAALTGKRRVEVTEGTQASSLRWRELLNQGARERCHRLVNKHTHTQNTCRYRRSDLTDVCRLTCNMLASVLRA